ncbi:MAG: nucleotide sugar dehydrogenase [Deltaproteobacteria bacterium]|nr:MAG: nucleotide sugar dehydrogenase [Deltaproteobacteria bacterium]
MTTLKDKLEEHTATTAVIGLGYVGLPLALEMVNAGFTVIGVDIDKKKIRSLEDGKSYISDVPDKIIQDALRKKKFYPTSDFTVLRKADTISICVPTPLSKSRDPDISFILGATEEIKKQLRPDQLIVLESTTYPGTTEELILPELESTGLKVGKDFFLAFSPERIDPGNKSFTTHNTPKVVGGVTSRCKELVKIFYSQFTERVVPVSSPKCAEMVKLLENTFRSINIGMVNEMALMCDLLGVDVYEVIDAAATKPFGFIPFYPGPGLGGHCIPIDPHYLAWKLKALNFQARFIALAAEINGMMPSVVGGLVTEALNRLEKSVRGAKVLILGVAYKKGVNDCRESPAIDVMQILKAKGARISYNDPMVPRLNLGGKVLESVELSPALIKSQDCVVILTNHDSYNLQDILRSAKVAVDTRNATKGLDEFQDKIIKLGAGNHRDKVAHDQTASKESSIQSGLIGDPTT